GAEHRDRAGQDADRQVPDRRGAAAGRTAGGLLRAERPAARGTRRRPVARRVGGEGAAEGGRRQPEARRGADARGGGRRYRGGRRGGRGGSEAGDARGDEDGGDAPRRAGREGGR